jgi:cytochrome c oxidase subunit 4
MAGHSEGSHSHDLGHIVPYKTYVTVLLVLFCLTAITVAVSRVDFGVMNLVVALLIASIKAGIVGMFFMHLKYENPLIWIYVAFPLILLAIMIGGIFIDNPNRNNSKIYYEVPAKAPGEAGAAEHHS